jgi:TRAP-type C4-dicarboxylate transport system permease small subunit
MLDISLYWLYISLPVGAAGALIISVLQLYSYVKGQEAD